MATSENLSHHYHQPKSVEQYGIEPIPARLKTVKWYDLFLLVTNFMINPATILIAGLAVSAGLSFWAALTAESAGVLLAFLPYITMATIGVDYGLPGQVATRMVFGMRGAKWMPSLLRAIASTYWFAVQTIVGATVIANVLDRWRGGSHSVVITGLFFAVIQVCFALIGYDWLRWLSRISFPVKILGLIYLFFLIAHNPDPHFAPHTVFHYHSSHGWQWLVFATFLNSMAAAWTTMITDAADFCRYSRTRKDMWWGTILAAVCATFFAGFLGAYASAATLGRQPNPFEVITEIDARAFTLIVILLVIVLDNWTINVLNLYTGGLSLTNAFEKIGRFWTTLFVGVVGSICSALPLLLNRLVGFTTVLGNVFAPIAGVLLVHYVVLQRMRIDVPGLFCSDGPYRYWKGNNWVAILWSLAGIGIYYALPVAVLQTISTIILTGAGYGATVAILVRISPQSRLLFPSQNVLPEAASAQTIL